MNKTRREFGRAVIVASLLLTLHVFAVLAQAPAPSQNDINDLAWSPDGATLAVGTGAGVWVYDAKNLQAPPKAYPIGYVAALAYSQDSAWLALGTNQGTVVVIDLQSGQTLATWQVQPSTAEAPVTVQSVAFSYDDKLIAAATSRNMTAVYELQAEEALWEDTTGNQPLVVRFNPDDKILAVGNASQSIDLRDVLSGKVVYHWRIEPMALNIVYDMAFNPLGDRLLIAGDAKRIFALDVDFGERAFVWDTRNTISYAVDWSPDGRRVAVVNESLADSSQDVIQVWEARFNGSEVATITNYGGKIRGLAFSPDGERIATLTKDGTLRVWQANDGQELERVALTLANP
jgi:WD40 repeat protein